MIADKQQAEEAWERFVTHLNKTQPLGGDRKHVSFLGSITSYKKLFIEAQCVPRDEQQHNNLVKE